MQKDYLVLADLHNGCLNTCIIFFLGVIRVLFVVLIIDFEDRFRQNTARHLHRLPDSDGPVFVDKINQFVSSFESLLRGGPDDICDFFHHLRISALLRTHSCHCD